MKCHKELQTKSLRKTTKLIHLIQEVHYSDVMFLKSDLISLFLWSYLIFTIGSLSKRGKTKCQIWKRKRDANPRNVEVELPVELGRAVGPNSAQFVTEASYLMKRCMPLNIEKWHHIHADKKRKFFMKLKVSFTNCN